MISPAHHAATCADQGSPAVCRCQGYRTPEQALAKSLAAAERRFPVGMRVRHILTLTPGEVDSLTVRGLSVMMTVRTKAGAIETLAGEWERAPL